MSNAIDLMTADTTIVVPCARGGISEASLNMLAEAQGKLWDEISQDIKDGKDEIVVRNP